MWSPKCVVFAICLKQREMCGPGVVPLYVLNNRMVPTHPLEGKRERQMGKKLLCSALYGPECPKRCQIANN